MQGVFLFSLIHPKKNTKKTVKVDSRLKWLVIHPCDKVVIDYIKASPAVVSLLICLAF